MSSYDFAACADLGDLGWSPCFAFLFDSLSHDGCVPARVARAERELYLLMHAGGMSRAVLAGRLRRGALEPGALPVVGDWVVARVEGDSARIEALLPRRTELARHDPSGVSAAQVLAANVDVVLLAAGLDYDFNPRRLERGAALAWQAGAEPVVVLTKADLSPDHSHEVSRIMAALPGTPVLAVSSLTGEGLDQVRAVVSPGVSAVLLGSSGTGKSTLVNRLLGDERQRTAEVRLADSKGRHVTTHRELFRLPGGGLLMDTPGLRAFGLAGGEGVAELFADVERLAVSCRFRDCRHEAEPGCGVKAALERGELTAERYASYLTLRREVERVERRRPGVPDLKAKRRDKDIGKAIKNYKKLTGR